MAEHTPEPWKVIRGWCFRVVGGHGGKVCEPSCLEDCARIVAAINATAGIPTETLAALGEGGVAKLRDKANITDELLDAVEAVVGMGSAAWDCIDPKELIAAVFVAALPKEQGDA